MNHHDDLPEEPHGDLTAPIEFQDRIRAARAEVEKEADEPGPIVKGAAYLTLVALVILFCAGCAALAGYLLRLAF